MLLKVKCCLIVSPIESVLLNVLLVSDRLKLTLVLLKAVFLVRPMFVLSVV